MTHDTRDEAAVPDLRERGRTADGQPAFSDRRLWIQLLVFEGAPDPGPLARALGGAPVRGALYADVNHPRGVGLAVAHEDPEYFAGLLRNFLNRPPFDALTLRPEFTMLGRTYALGYEPDLDRVLLARPVERLCNPAWPWAMWYPVRRTGAFETLNPAEQREILMEHAGLGAAWSKGGHAYDIRLACHGMDRADNDFVLGLVGPNLHPLSAMVQAMRRTKQTSRYLASLGPFFVGRAVWQSPPA
ncbi:MAG: hypothetical protein BWK77_01335 [Verrucomicrobia bacterium A1]|nr:MAG: hypothetical protein BWK77_01335 [Verrucomicrobia bacterium A1]